jgi:hypothetical protein
MAMAQEVADRVQSDAKAEAEKVVANATREADILLHKAREQAAATEAESKRQRGDLEGKIEQLKVFERTYRTQLRSYLQTQLAELDTDKQLAKKN